MNEDKLADIHQQARAEFDQIQGALYQERMNCLGDRRFCSLTGAQWEGPLGSQFENKPRFEVNKVHMAVQRIINEYRNNRITVNFVSRAGEEYANAFEESVMGDFGAWRLRTDY